ncbi:c-type cytochrome [Pontibacter akesuensis]|uniref:Quinol:cytochrome c oxidoreductase monoheme cytochrome subunit n=1 Tax=Pontibacter akesuensis TaxID=388950 RepID=A0A1I7J0S6_9BACT|nr:cytochrome c [Pontibacter akesuensis]GHA73156.1 cytochrome c [Pontibacter akesuensis]SFU78778.1 quinol:cytochrome c oxidoreductase monoheme cytochrome subunit [Pontibacter akesuensis]
MKRYKTLGLKASALFFSSAVLFACGDKSNPGYEYAPDMYHSVPLDPYSQIKENKFNPAGMNMREPAKGTVPRGMQGYNLYLSVDTAEVAGVELANPLKRTELNLAEGQVLYSRFCAPCHGEQGDGQGLVGIKFKGVPSYTAGRVAELPAGHIYHVITYGRGRMMPHGSQVNPTERWKIVMYVQQLQKGEVGAAVEEEVEEEAGGETITDNPVTGTPEDTPTRETPKN